MNDRQSIHEKIREALQFYADPENYHAIGFLCDPPCGGFAEDFSTDHGHPDYDRPMPGKRAREALRELLSPPEEAATGADPIGDAIRTMPVKEWDTRSALQELEWARSMVEQPTKTGCYVVADRGYSGYVLGLCEFYDGQRPITNKFWLKNLIPPTSRPPGWVPRVRFTAPLQAPKDFTEQIANMFKEAGYHEQSIWLQYQSSKWWSLLLYPQNPLLVSKYFSGPTLDGVIKQGLDWIAARPRPPEESK